MKYYLERFLDDRARKIIKEYKLEIKTLETDEEYEDLVRKVITKVSNSYPHDSEYMHDLIYLNYPCLPDNGYLDYRHNMLEIEEDGVALTIGLSIRRDYDRMFYYTITVIMVEGTIRTKEYKEGLLKTDIKRITEVFKKAAAGLLEDNFVISFNDVIIDLANYTGHVFWSNGVMELDNSRIKEIYDFLEEAYINLEELKEEKYGNLV